ALLARLRRQRRPRPRARGRAAPRVAPRGREGVFDHRSRSVEFLPFRRALPRSVRHTPPAGAPPLLARVGIGLDDGGALSLPRPLAPRRSGHDPLYRGGRLSRLLVRARRSAP